MSSTYNLQARLQDPAFRADWERHQRDERAAAVCQARAQLARNAHPGNAVSLLDLDGIAAGNQAFRMCVALYREHGVMPSF